jgi:hypothetical protein
MDTLLTAGMQSSLAVTPQTGQSMPKATKRHIFADLVCSG